ncbi:unnamed protein product [Blepharisma stoltei]|uniref:Uncharacterized protein n=1 Tax=Blepharisma stoltei TaxID=1481888 RepID=A0AAU9IV31_9CILI|nr:unnamed protein product [Blepharisma stoltei]
MQDFYRWVNLASSLKGNHSILGKEIESFQNTANELDLFMQEWSSKLDILSKSNTILEMDLEAHESHLRSFAKILYRKKRSIIKRAVSVCTECIKDCMKSDEEISKQKINLIYDILKQIAEERRTPKTLTEKIRFLKLERAAENAVKLIVN